MFSLETLWTQTWRWLFSWDKPRQIPWWWWICSLCCHLSIWPFISEDMDVIKPAQHLAKSHGALATTVTVFYSV